MTLFKNSRRFYRAYPQMVQLFRAAPQFFRQIGPTVSDELQIAEIQLVEKSASVMHQFISSPEAIISRIYLGVKEEEMLRRCRLQRRSSGRK